VSTGDPTTAPALPLVDLDGWRHGDTATRAALAATVDEALRTVGFLVVAGGGVSAALTAELRGASATFFALPAAAKAGCATRVGGRGWIPPGAEANSYSDGVASPPDLKETFTAGHDPALDDPDAAARRRNVWPDTVPELRPLVEAYTQAMAELSIEILQLFGAALGLDPDTLVSVGPTPPATLNVNHYPPLSATGPVADGQFRIGAHSDFGVLTVLDRQPGYGGLQIETLDGRCVYGPFVPGTLTINIGDLLARWTGDRWRSTRHRVLPPDERAADEALTSLVYFFSVAADTPIETLAVGGPTRYEPVRAGEHLARQLAAIDVAP